MGTQLYCLQGRLEEDDVVQGYERSGQSVATLGRHVSVTEEVRRRLILGAASNGLHEENE